VRGQTANGSSSARKKIMAHVEENENNDRRRSTRLVSPRTDDPIENKSDKRRKRTREPSPVPLRRGRSKRTKT
jgi:hypothetical protein